MKYYLIAGEASGDLHGSNLIKELRKADPSAELRGFGGDLMENEGMTLVKDYRELAFMGIVGVLMNLGKIKANFKLCKKDIINFNPDVLILIDYPGFNLKMAKFAKKINLKVCYYIAPKIWAWKSSRIKTIKKYVDKLFGILPFEVDYYKERQFSINYVGNPTLDLIDEIMNKQSSPEDFIQQNQLSEKPIIALLPGSRKQELEMMLPEMLQLIDEYKDYQFVIAGAPSLLPEVYNKIIQDKKIKVLFNQTYNILQHAKAAIVASGTATLEAALFNVPEVVCFKTYIFTYRLGKLFVHIPFFSLVNIIMNKEVVKELLQFNLAEDIKTEMDKILYNNEYREAMLMEFRNLRNILGSPGASRRTATEIVSFIK